MKNEMIIRPTPIILNKTLNEFVTDMHNEQYEVLRKSTNKKDEHRGSILRSPVNPRLSKFLYLNSGILNKCIRAIAEDTILGQISCKDSDVARFWNNNQNELFMLMKDYLLYGYAIAELIFTHEPIKSKKGELLHDPVTGEVRTNDKLVTIRQAPADSFTLYNINDAYYAEQNLNGNTKMLNIHGEIYPEDDKVETEGTILWIGGDELYRWFSIPQWYASRTQLLMNITLTDLDIDTFQKGNLMSGLLLVSGGRQIVLEGEKSIGDQLQEQFSSVGTGLAVTYLENASKDQPTNAEYINLTSNNYEYIQSRYSDNEQSVLESFFIPKERLLNNDTKESMNSNKSEIIWNTYIRSLRNTQSKMLEYCQTINSFYLKNNNTINISLPTFEDNTQIAIQNVSTLMQLGLMSQSEAVEYLNDNLDIALTTPSGVYADVKAPLNLTNTPNSDGGTGGQ